MIEMSFGRNELEDWIDSDSLFHLMGCYLLQTF